MSCFQERTEHTTKRIGPEGGFVALMDSTATFLFRLGSMGGFGYVLFGTGLLVLLIALVVPVASENMNRWLMLFSAALALAGFVFGIVERILAYRIARVKLEMMLSVTEKLIMKIIQPLEHLDSAVVKSIVNDVFGMLWGFELKEHVMAETGSEEKKGDAS